MSLDEEKQFGTNETRSVSGSSTIMAQGFFRFFFFLFFGYALAF